MISYRLKQEKNSTCKYDRIWNKMTKKEQMKFFGFAVRVASDPRSFWEPNTRQELIERYGENIERLMFGDYLGARIVDLDQARAEHRLKQLAKKGPNISVSGFDVIFDRYDDHQDRTVYGKPGGIHYTFVDAGLTNYPIEVQFLDFKSQILDMFGPYAHEIYEGRRKIQESRT